MSVLNGIIPQELLTITDSLNFEEDGYMLITSLDYFADDLNVEFIVNPGGFEEDGRKNQLWQLQAGNLKTEKLDVGWTQDLICYSDHYLLLDYTSYWTELYFRGKTADPNKLLADIYTTHKKAFDNWIDVEKYLSLKPDLLSLCSSGFGLFAKGPEDIMAVYEACLIAHGMNPHYSGKYKGPDSHLGDTPLKLLIFGDSYFIAESFEFTRI